MSFGSVIRTLVLASLFLGASCAFKKDDDKVKSDDVRILMDDVKRREEDDNSAMFTDNEVEFTYKGGREPYSYLAVLRWPKRLPHVHVYVNGATRESTSAGALEFEVRSGQTFEVQIDSLNARNRLVRAMTFKRIVPMDHVFVGSQPINEDLNIEVNRVFFKEHAELVLNSYNLSIKANEILIADTSAIRTLSSSDEESTNRTHDERILKNSQIAIIAERIVGKLEVRLFGMNGSHGKNAVEPGEFQKPSRAQDGQNGVDAVVDVIRGPNGIEAKVCVHSASSGQNGKDGLEGVNGEHGSRGGSSGSLLISANDYGDAEVTIVAKAGLPGEGGLPSRGQLGGRKGKAGRSWEPCAYYAKDGVDGKDGKDGVKGQDGAPGALGEISFPKKVKSGARGAFRLIVL